MNWSAVPNVKITRLLEVLFELFVDGVVLASTCLPFSLAGSSEIQIVLNYVYEQLNLQKGVYIWVHKGVFLQGVDFWEDTLLMLKASKSQELVFIVTFWLDEYGNVLSIKFIHLDDLLWELRLHPNHPNPRIDSAGVFLDGCWPIRCKMGRARLKKLWSGLLVYSAEKHTFVTKQCRISPSGVRL